VAKTLSALPLAQQVIGQHSGYPQEGLPETSAIWANSKQKILLFVTMAILAPCDLKVGKENAHGISSQGGSWLISTN
jgi:hypothetical protein